RCLYEDVVLANGELDFAAIFGEGSLEELHGSRGYDGHIADGRRAADCLGRAFHFGEAAAIGADGCEYVVLPFELDAAQGVAAALVVGGEDRTADQLTEETGRDFVADGFAELGDGRELGRILNRELELAALAADGRRGSVGFDAKCLVGAFAK